MFLKVGQINLSDIFSKHPPVVSGFNPEPKGFQSYWSKLTESVQNWDYVVENEESSETLTPLL